MRDPTRDGFSAAQVSAAHRLLARAEARPQGLWLPLVNQVLTELDDHQERVRVETETALQKLEAQVNRAQSIMAAHGLGAFAANRGLTAVNFPAIASQLVDRYVAASLHVRKPRGIERSALARIAANTAPSQKGQQAKDCMVIESYLHIARGLRSQQVQEPIVFLTANTRDYSERLGSSILHQDLLGDFGAVNMIYSVNFEMAAHFL
jgi:hypothetical protein